MSMLTAMLLILLIALNFITKMITYNQTSNTLEQIAVSEIQAWEDYDSPDGMPDDTPPSRRENGDSTEENTTEEETESATTTINTEEETTSTSIYSYVDENGEIQTRIVTVDNAKSEQETQAENSLETAPLPSETTAVTKNTTQTQAKTTEATKATQNEQNGTNNG